MRLDHYKHIKFERDGRILRVIINRGETLNRVDAELHDELSHVFYDVAADATSEIIVLEAAGRCFSAGGDINYMEEQNASPAGFQRSIREAKRIVFNLLDCDKPVICKVQGDAIGLGTTLAFFCDIVVAADHARFCDPHVSVGLVAGDGGAVIWPQLCGYMRAKYYLLTGEMISATQAVEMGLINFAVPAAELDAKVNEIAQRLASGATKAIRWTKVTMNVGLKQLAHSMMDAGMAYEGLANATNDHSEAIKAFKAKRKPVFPHS